MKYLIIACMTLSVLNINLSYFVFPMLIIMGYVLRNKLVIKVEVFNNYAFFLLLLFGFFYALEYGISITSFRIYFITPLLVYMAGWFSVDGAGEKYETEVLKLIAAMIAGFALHGLLNALSNSGSSRNMIEDVFYGKLLSATCASAINTTICSLLTCLIFMVRKRIVKVLGFLCLIIALWYASILGSRTQIIITVAVFAVTFLLYVKEESHNRTIIRTLGIMLLVVGVVSVIYYFDIFSVRTTVENSNLYMRFVVSQKDSDSLRIERFIEGITTVFKEPFGVPGAKYYHNFWLDVGRLAGVIPFMCILAYSIVTTIHVLKMFRAKQLPQLFRFTILSVYMGLMMNLFVEPAMEGMFDIVMSYVFINGAVECFYSKSRKSEYKNNLSLEESK